MLRRGSGPSVSSGLMRLLSYAFVQIVGTRMEEARQRAERRVSEIATTVALRAVGAFLAMLAVVWLSIGGTLALATRMETWAACLIVSGALAAGALVLFTVRSRRSHGDRGLASTSTEEAKNGYPEI
ncbi:MAG: phage holin family protein [Acetobacterales bacterium]